MILSVIALIGFGAAVVMSMAVVLPIPDTSVLVGSNVLIFHNGDPVAFMDEVDIDRNYNQTAIRAIGSWFAKDFKSLFFDGRMTGRLHLLGDKEDGGITLPVLEEILTSKGELFEFRRKQDGKRIMRAICKLDTEASNIASNAPSSRRVTFVIVRIAHSEGYN